MQNTHDTLQILPLIKLAPSEYKITAAGPDHFGVSVYSKLMDGVPVRHWQRWSVLDFPNDLFGLEDLEKAGLKDIYMAAVLKSQSCGSAKILGGAI